MPKLGGGGMKYMEGTIIREESFDLPLHFKYTSAVLAPNMILTGPWQINVMGRTDDLVSF
jgi:hypothetical protein